MIREYTGLQLYISYKMAEYAHKKVNSSLRFKENLPPKTVWQFVNKNLSKSITKLLSLESCVETIIPKAAFKHEKGKNIYSGYFEPTYKVVMEEYYKTISSRVIKDAEYNKLK